MSGRIDVLAATIVAQHTCPLSGVDTADGSPPGRPPWIVKWDLDSQKPMKGAATGRVLALIRELEAEGLL